MDLTRLAAKQKRVLDIRDFIKNEVLNHQAKATLSSVLATYSKLLAKCWEAKTITSENELALSSLERELLNLHEDARLSGGIL